jgi:hypothetical protein
MQKISIFTIVSIITILSTIQIFAEEFDPISELYKIDPLLDANSQETNLENEELKTEDENLEIETSEISKPESIYEPLPESVPDTNFNSPEISNYQTPALLTEPTLELEIKSESAPPIFTNPPATNYQSQTQPAISTEIPSFSYANTIATINNQKYATAPLTQTGPAENIWLAIFSAILFTLIYAFYVLHYKFFQ